MKTTATPEQKSSLTRLVYPFLAVLTIIYVFIIYKNARLFSSKTSSATEIFVINATVAIPELIIWAMALISSLRFKEYARSIQQTRDGRSMNYLADALVVMSFYVILITSENYVVGLFKNTSNLRTIVSVENYLPLAVALASSGILLIGSLKLNQIVPLKVRLSSRIALATVFIIVVALFSWHFDKSYRNLVPQNGIPRFVLPIHTLLMTYILLHIVMWAIGIAACVNIANYSLHTKGKIYKRLFNNLYKGILLVFICTFVAQLFIISNVNLTKFSLSLVLIYCLLVLAGLGFILIYKGSNDLNLLERI